MSRIQNWKIELTLLFKLSCDLEMGQGHKNQNEHVQLIYWNLSDAVSRSHHDSQQQGICQVQTCIHYLPNKCLCQGHEKHFVHDLIHVCTTNSYI